MWSTRREYQAHEKRLDVTIRYRAELFDISGENPEHVAATKMLLENL